MLSVYDDDDVRHPYYHRHVCQDNSLSLYIYIRICICICLSQYRAPPRTSPELDRFRELRIYEWALGFEPHPHRMFAEGSSVRGFVKGYAFIEYENKQEADAAIKAIVMFCPCRKTFCPGLLQAARVLSKVSHLTILISVSDGWQ